MRVGWVTDFPLHKKLILGVFFATGRSSWTASDPLHSVLALQAALQSADGFLPVTQEEIDSLCGVVGAFQGHIFVRYQARAAAKFFTSTVFMMGPLVAGLTPTQHTPGFNEGLKDKRYLIAGITFVIADLLEW